MYRGREPGVAAVGRGEAFEQFAVLVHADAVEFGEYGASWSGGFSSYAVRVTRPSRRDQILTDS